MTSAVAYFVLVNALVMLCEIAVEERFRNPIHIGDATEPIRRSVKNKVDIGLLIEEVNVPGASELPYTTA